MRRRRNGFKIHPSPTQPMSSRRTAFPDSVHRPSQPPADLSHFVAWFERQADARERFRWVLRDSIDELLDGQRTGRWCYQQLSKTEKTHLGTVVEVNLTKEFEIPNGADLDWRVAKEDLDCKFSKDLGGWEIPMEMYLCEDHGERQGSADHAALLVWVNDDDGQWAAGLMRITDAKLRWKPGTPPCRAYNRDNKRRISETSYPEIYWLWGAIHTDLPVNTLLALDEAARARIFANASSGQARVDALFREIQGEIVSRAVVLTVGQQDDAPKRARDARIHLKQEGIVVLGHQESHPHIAELLGLPVPEKGEWVSTGLVAVPPEDERGKVFLDGRYWSRPRDGESVADVAPDVPKRLPPQPHRPSPS